MTHTDAEVFRGKWSSGRHFTPLQLGPQPPYVPGMDVSGKVLAVGRDVRHIRVGDEVVAFLPVDTQRGGCAGMVVADMQHVYPKPAHVAHQDAAAALSAGAPRSVRRRHGVR